MKIYNKIGSKERLFEMMQGVNKVKLNENRDQELNNTLMTAIQKLKSGALRVDQGGTNKTALQTVNDASYVGINGYDAEKNMYNFNFKITGMEGDQDGVFNIDDVILEKFYFQNPQGEKVFDVDENQLVDFNKQYGSQLYDIVEKYVGEDLQPAGEFDEESETLQEDVDDTNRDSVIKYYHSALFSDNEVQKNVNLKKKLKKYFFFSIEDFNGLSNKSFDGNGNYSFGLSEQIIFPEIDYDKIDQVRGMNITIATNASNDEEAYKLLLAFGFPIIQKKSKG